MTTAPRLNRSWCAVYQWPGKARLIFGTVVMPRDAKQNEIDDALAAALATIIPDDCPRPALIELRAGALFYAPENGEKS